MPQIMNSHLLYENEQRRREISLWRLLCFVMFCVWQMGIIYYIGPALNIDGRTPLPILADNLTVLIVAGYVCSIICMIVLPRKVIWLSRISTLVALVSAIGLFCPLGTTVLTLLIYIQCFCCCYMIGFESATIVHYFNSNSATRHLLIAYPIGYILIAFIQSDFISMDFSVFRILMLVMLSMLLYFFMKMSPEQGIRFVRKSDGLAVPKRFLGFFLLLAFLSALLGVIAPAAAAEVEHGVFAAYISCAVSSLVLYFLSKKTGSHPISFVTYIIGISAIGYVLLVVSEYVPALGMVAAILIGVGMSACALLPLFALLVVKQYPSKFIVPGYIGLAMLAVIVQSVLVEIFRESVVLLNLSYFAIVVILTIIYVMLEPFLLYSVRRKFEEPELDEADGRSAEEGYKERDDNVAVRDEISSEGKRAEKSVEGTESIERTESIEDTANLEMEVSEAVTEKKIFDEETGTKPDLEADRCLAGKNTTEGNVEEDNIEKSTVESDVLDKLTKREKEVVDLISCGYSNGDIAKMLFISEYTVKDHTKNIYRKLEVHSRFELMALVNRRREK